MTNRYTNLSFGDLNKVGLLQLPYQQLDELLGQQKALIDTTNQLTNHAPKYIQESTFATDAAKQINQYQQQTKEKLAQIAATGNTRDYMAALDQTQQEIAKLYRPGGLAYNLEQDYAKYTEQVTKEQERLAKGEIESTQYQVNVKNALSDYDQSQGVKRFNMTPKPQAVNFDEFANKFIANYKDTDLVKRGNFRSINGRWVYDDTKVTGVEAQKVLRDLTNAFSNAASTTGQLQDRFNVLNENGKLTNDYKAKQLQQSSGMLNLLNKTDLAKKGDVESLQKQLNDLGLDTGGVDGKVGPKTKAAIELAKKSAETTIETLNQTDVSTLTPEAQQDFYSTYVNSLATPYASATGRQKEERKFTNFGEQLWWLKQKADLENKSKEDSELNLLIRTLPASKSVPKDVKFYTQGNELKKNTNVSADKLKAEGEFFNFMPGYEQGMKVLSFFDRLFTENDKVNIDTEPTLVNIREHLIANNPTLASATPEVINQAVIDELNRQEEGTIDARYTAGNTKFKKAFDDTFVPVLDKDGKLKNVGNLINFEFTNRGGVKLSGQNFAKLATEKGETISYKGAVTDIASDLPYGSTVLAVGNDEIYMEPDIATTYDPNTLINAGYRAINNAEVGNAVDFKYQGKDMNLMFKTDGSFNLTDKQSNATQTVYPVLDSNGTLVGISPKKQ